MIILHWSFMYSRTYDHLLQIVQEASDWWRDSRSTCWKMKRFPDSQGYMWFQVWRYYGLPLKCFRLQVVSPSDRYPLRVQTKRNMFDEDKEWKDGNWHKISRCNLQVHDCLFWDYNVSGKFWEKKAQIEVHAIQVQYEWILFDLFRLSLNFCLKDRSSEHRHMSLEVNVDFETTSRSKKFPHSLSVFVKYL